MSTAAAADAAADISQNRPEAVAAKALGADDQVLHQSAAGAVQRQLGEVFAGQALEAHAQHANADSASESIEVQTADLLDWLVHKQQRAYCTC